MSRLKSQEDVIVEGRTFTRIKNFVRMSGMARETVIKYIEAGKITGIRLGRCIWVEKNTLANCLK